MCFISPVSLKVIFILILLIYNSNNKYIITEFTIHEARKGKGKDY